MKDFALMLLIYALLLLILPNPEASSNDRLQKSILEVFPHADINNDGVLSEPEDAAIWKAALNAYPRADSDGDGTLSKAEKALLLRKVQQAASRRGSTIPPLVVSSSKENLPQATRNQEFYSSDSDSAPIRQGPRLIKPGQHGIGRQIPDMSFADISNRQHRLSDFADKKAVVIAMTGTGCPLCLKYAPTLGAIERKYRVNDVAFVFINPNESERGERLTRAISQHGFQGPYVSDGKKSLTRILGTKSTTEVFVIDQTRTLVYRGAVDDQYGFAYSLKEPRNRYLTAALDAVLQERTPEWQATTSPGCELFYDTTNERKVPLTITYHNRISRILQNNCIDCHREGGISPMPLETYEEVKDHVGMIRNVVTRGIMPPWFAASPARNVDGHGEALHWANDRTLSSTEKKDLFAWIEAGLPEGNRADAPLPKTFPNGWLIGKPDAVFEFPQPVPVKATGVMPYKTVTVETDLSEEKWVQAIEIRPERPDVVHHVIVSIQDNGREIRERDGYWAVYVPGNSTLEYPDGFARRLPKGAKLRFQMHYTPNGTATTDRTRIGLVFSTEPPQHEVKVAGIANSRIRIPPHADDHREDANLRLPYNAQILSFMPHMHLRGKAARFEAMTTKGTTTLLNVPRYDFNWQLRYRLAVPLLLHQGDTIRFTCWFDNSSKNPANPDPNRTVTWGQQTEDEMHIGYVEYFIPGKNPNEIPTLDSRGQHSTGINEDDRDANLVFIGDQRIRVSELIAAIRNLDRNQDGQLVRAEVPAKHLKLFELLDANDDDALTVDETRESVRRHQKR